MITVEVEGLAALIKNIDAMAAELGMVRGDILEKLAIKQANLIKSGTRAGMDLSGNVFRPLVLRVGSPLDDTGKMLGAVHAVRVGENAAAVIIGTGTENKKGIMHQYGTGLYNSNGSTGRIHAGSGRRALGPVRTSRVNEWNAKIKKGRAFFASVAGTPQRKWFGFRPGDNDALAEEAKKIFGERIIQIAKRK